MTYLHLILQPGNWGVAQMTIEDRITRLEALDAIRQLPAKYALALDMRDMDAMVSLFPADVRVGKQASGREALRAYMDTTLRAPFTDKPEWDALARAPLPDQIVHRTFCGT